MGSRISEICVNVVDPEVMAAFWSAALGYPVIARDDEGVAIMGAPDRPSLLFVRTDDLDGPPKANPNRLHLDLSPTGDDQQAEVARLEGLGATRIDIGQGSPSWVVMADPEGNEFCVLRRTVPPEPEPFDAPIAADAAVVVSGTERFSVRDLEELSGLVADAWTAGTDRDWSVPAGTLEWSCLATADHAVDCVYAPTFFLASRRTDAYPTAGGDLTLGASAAPGALVESLQIETRILVAVVRATDADVRSILFPSRRRAWCTGCASTPVRGRSGRALETSSGTATTGGATSSPHRAVLAQRR